MFPHPLTSKGEQMSIDANDDLYGQTVNKH